MVLAILESLYIFLLFDIKLSSYLSEALLLWICILLVPAIHSLNVVLFQRGC